MGDIKCINISDKKILEMVKKMSEKYGIPEAVILKSCSKAVNICNKILVNVEVVGNEQYNLD